MEGGTLFSGHAGSASQEEILTPLIALEMDEVLSTTAASPQVEPCHPGAVYKHMGKKCFYETLTDKKIN